MERMTKENITEESIASRESELKQLKSKEAELIELVMQMQEVDRKINELDATINRNERELTPPPSVLSLGSMYDWDDYFAESREWIRNNEEQNKRKRDLDDLKAKREEISSKIVELVPSTYHDIQIVFKDNRRISVNGNRVTTYNAY